MANKRKGKTSLSDNEIVSLLERSVTAGCKFVDTKLARERKRVIDYYNGLLPAPVHGGNSKYVSTDVCDTIESMKATLLESFSASSDIVQFSPKGDDDVREAEISTAYAKHVIFEQNEGTELFGTVIQDGLMARVGIAKVYWKEQIDEIEETFEDLDQDTLAVLLQDDEVKLLALDQDDDDDDGDPGLFSGTISRREDNSRVQIDTIPPEEFIVNPTIKSLEGETVTHRTEKTRTELISEGYDKKLVESLTYSDASLRFDPERIARFEPVGTDIWARDQEGAQEATRVFVVYESYAWLDMDNSGVAKMWRVVWCGAVVLEKEQVDRHPFKLFVPLPTPHAFHGANLAARVIPIQNAKTVLTRSILDHAVVANNPRYGVVKGALTNPRELIDNRIGGLVNVTRPDGIFPLPQAPLNPFVFQTISMLDEDKEDATGVSRLSQGLNKDALSSQNAQGMVEQLINASMQRQKTIARAFAIQFLKPLFLEVYRLVVENEKKQRIIDIAGDWVPVTPSSWRKMRDVTVDLRLGYGERDRLAGEYLQFGQMLSADQGVSPLYGQQQRYNLYRKVLEIKGHKDVNSIIADPKTVPPPKPDPMAMLELQLKQQELQLNGRKQDLAEKEFEAQTQLAQMKEDFEKRFKTLEYVLASHEQERKTAETQNRIEISQQEMALAEKQQAATPLANDKTSAIISPNG